MFSYSLLPCIFWIKLLDWNWSIRVLLSFCSFMVDSIWNNLYHWALKSCFSLLMLNQIAWQQIIPCSDLVTHTVFQEIFLCCFIKLCAFVRETHVLHQSQKTNLMMLIQFHLSLKGQDLCCNFVFMIHFTFLMENCIFFSEVDSQKVPKQLGIRKLEILYLCVRVSFLFPVLIYWISPFWTVVVNNFCWV